MSALHTPTLPRRGTLRAHPQPGTALPKEEHQPHNIKGHPEQHSPTIGARPDGTHRRFQTDGTHRRHDRHSMQQQTDRRLLTYGELPPHDVVVVHRGKHATNKTDRQSAISQSNTHSNKQTFNQHSINIHSNQTSNHSINTNIQSFNQGQRAGGVKVEREFERASVLLTGARGSKGEI